MRGNAIANYLGQGWSVVMGFAFIPLYIRFLGLETYGLIGVFALLQAWLSLLDLGVTAAISREMARFRGGAHNAQSIRALLRSVEIAGIGLALLVMLVVWVLAQWLASDWLRVEKLSVSVVARAFNVMGVVAALRFIENIYRGSIVGLQRQVTLNVVGSVVATLRGAGSVAVLAWFSPSIDAFFLWHGLVSGLAILAYAILVYRWLPSAGRRPPFSLAPLSSVWQFAAGTVAVTLLGFLLSQADKVILGSLLSLESFAVYSLAYTVASAVRQIAQPLDQAVYPGMTQLFQRGDETGLATLYHKSTQYNAVLMGGVGIFLAVFGERVLALWTQDHRLAHDAYAVLRILVLGMVLNGIMNGPYYLQMAAGWTGLLVRVNGFMVLLFVPLTYLLTKHYAMTGAAASWLLLNLVYVAIVARLMHRRLLRNEMRQWYTRDLLMPLAAAATVAGVVRLLAPSYDTGLSALVFLTLALALIVLTGSLAASSVRAALSTQLKLVLNRLS